nr:endolytic transglycosylase MltG [Schaalia sp. lx-260]
MRSRRDMSPAERGYTSESSVPTPMSAPPVSIETTGMRSRRLEHERRRARRRRRNRRIRSFIVLVCVLALIGVALNYAWYALTNDAQKLTVADDYPGPGTGSVEVVVESGETGTDIGNKLVQADVVKSLAAFIRAWESNKAASSIRPGTYTLKQKMNASQAVADLLDSANRTDNTVTVNSGETLKQIVDRFTSVSKFSVEEVNAALQDTAALGLPVEAKGNVEGWLAPGAYELATSDTPATIFAKMISATITQLDSLSVPPADRETVLIKASILEREVNLKEYMSKVARVIENRLNNPEAETRGRLQMDSTVLYGVGKTGGVPTSEDLNNDNPYNTYLHAGLPPTPISQPSLTTIKAVLSPAAGNWLYFTTVNLETGETLFAETLAEQNQNVDIFKEYCRTHRGKC